MDKSPDAFRTISEVAGDLDLPQHVLRFWETRFNQIRPLKRGGGRRYYRPDDVDLLKGIRHLLYGEGYTIRGVQRILKEEGVRFVMDVWREGAPQPPRAGRQADDDVPAYAGQTIAEPPTTVWDAEEEADAAFLHAGLEQADADAEAEAPPPNDGDEAPVRIEPTMDPEIRAAHVLAQRFAPRAAAPTVDPAPPGLAPSLRVGGASAAFAEPGRVGLGHLLDRLRPQAPQAVAPSVATPPAAVVASLPGEGSTGLSRDDIRRLQATLFELLECKRLLDQMR